MQEAVHPPVSVYKNQTYSAPIVKTRVSMKKLFQYSMHVVFDQNCMKDPQCNPI